MNKPYEVWIRDLTVDNDFCLLLPMQEYALEEKLNRNHEYIIIDITLNCGEYENIYELNRILIEWDQCGIDNDTIEILQHVFTWNEMVEHIENDWYAIVDLDAETSSCVCSNGEKKGLCLHELGYMQLPFEDKYSKEMEDWIDWEQLWTEAECNGWVEVNINYHTYLVYRN